ncbi:hypothetical protein JD844_000109 [Phrynosoma platyrhinos]|uniref:Dynein regulatory complex subunit 7 n=1 Tax=Phrynosoma platyrhinos TaxID=52577 RepID=A0ABQ7SQ76_PHRPL|nr:hypothetical protein JD844_000109 [Phrynosoma platyrhinos]
METSEEEYESFGEEEEEEFSSSRLSDEVQDLEKQLSQIQVHIPEVVYEFDWKSIDVSNLPESYRTNSPKEELLLKVADNFHHQYAHLCPDREPLFLHPVNECGVEVAKEATQEKPKKYAIRPLRDLTSKYEQQEEAKQEAKLQEVEEKKKKEEEERRAEAQKPKPDTLYGLRVHAWVLVLSGKREVPESFFIDPFTGKSYTTTDDHFLGIESDLLFDLGDPVHWEFMLLGADKPLLSMPEVEEEEEMGDDEVEVLLKEEEPKGFDMPASWVKQIQISPKEFETRCPQGKKVIQYKNAKLEKWAPYLNSNGLVSRLTVYEDLDCTKVLEVKEWYKNREDVMETRELNKQTEVTTEFHPGSLFAFLAHIYKTMDPETDRTMEFYHETRVDGLEKRIETPTDMTEYFVGRSDFLYYRHTEFGKRVKKVAAILVNTETNARPIVKITERFHRNPSKLADEDVAERIFSISEEKIYLTYHRKKNYITPSKREFNKRSDVDNTGNKIVMTPDMCNSYQAGSTEKEKKLFHLYEMLMNLIEDEKSSRHQVWESEIEQELDYLAPFLIQIGGVEKMTKWLALRLKEDCLSDFKHRLVDKANLIQARFEKKKQQWYQQNQLNMTLEDEDAYLNYCSDAMFRIRILELRLSKYGK